MNINEIIVIGQGSVANMCFKEAQNYFKDKNVSLISNKFSLTKEEIEALNLKFNSMQDNLIISANNFYIFKEPCINNNLIINYHNAKLPRHRGVNAHVFSIYEGDKETGISWHLVNNKIDDGDLLYQESITIDNDDTALSLLTRQQKIAIETLTLALDNLISNKSYPQDNNIEPSLHKKGELPNNGIFDLDAPFDIKCRFLRSMNCGRGAFRAFKLPIIYIDNEPTFIKSYQIEYNTLTICTDIKDLIFRR